MKKNYFLLVVVSILFGLSSCSDDTGLKTTEQDEKVGDLIVPKNFNWQTTRKVLCRINSNVSLPVYIYNAEECADEGLVAVYHLFPEKENSFSLKLPTYLKTVYIKYSDSNPVAVPVNNGEINYTIPPSTRSGGCETCGTEGDLYDYYYYPCKGDAATVLFEDLFPAKGDYDFNDYVANYNYICYMDPKSKEIRQIDFFMTVVALGGVLGYDPCIRIDGIATDYIRRIAFYGDGIIPVHFPAIDNEWCARFQNATTRPAGCKYLNTDPNETVISRRDLKDIKLVVEFNTKDLKPELTNFPTLADLKDLDVFITSDKMEIHERGDDTAIFAYPSFDGCGDENYCDKQNLIWAFEVPSKIAHAIERTDFLKAYPRFADWVKSEGDDYSLWYKSGNSQYLVNIPD